jgi:hypothetical protein
MPRNGDPAKPSTRCEKAYKLSEHFKHMNKISTFDYYGMKFGDYKYQAWILLPLTIIMSSSLCSMVVYIQRREMEWIKTNSLKSKRQNINSLQDIVYLILVDLGCKDNSRFDYKLFS